MRDLVHHRVADDRCLAPRRYGHPLDGSTKNADAVGKVGLLRATRSEGHAFVQTEEGSAFRDLLRRRLVLDHDFQIPNPLAELRRQLV